MNEQSEGATNLLAAALHYNPELKKEVEDWVRNMVRDEFMGNMNSSHNFERMHINNFPTFKRLVREVLKQDFESLRNHGL